MNNVIKITSLAAFLAMCSACTQAEALQRIRKPIAPNIIKAVKQNLIAIQPKRPIQVKPQSVTHAQPKVTRTVMPLWQLC